MRKVISIILISLYFVGATEACQLLKLPAFIIHFQEHLQENASVSLWSFLQEHYSDKLVIDDDFQKDMQLPFKTIDDCCTLITVSLLPQKIQLGEVVSFDEMPQHSEYPRHFFHQSLCKDIFQPPKTVQA